MNSSYHPTNRFGDILMKVPVGHWTFRSIPVTMTTLANFPRCGSVTSHRKRKVLLHFVAPLHQNIAIPKSFLFI
jgi:hypothetical protein